MSRISMLESRITTILGGAAPRDREELAKPIPTVFIGLGGSGKEVVMRLRKRFFDRFNPRDPVNPRDPGYARFVFIDTDTQTFVPRGESAESYAELIPSQEERVNCPITSAQFHKVFADLNARVNCEHLSWLKPEMERVGPEAVGNGAGTHRQFGRLAFYLNYAAIRHTLDRQISETLGYAAADPRVEDGRIEIVIVTSVAGGTGSGMFIDVAFLVQDLLNQPNRRPLTGKNVTVIGFLPGLFEEQKDLFPRFQQNAFASFLELEYYGTPRTGDELFLGDLRTEQQREGQWAGFWANWGDGHKRFIRGPGWDSCFLVDNRNDLDPNMPLPAGEVFQMAADYLFLDFENNEFATAKRSARSNLVQYKDRVKETWVRRPGDQNASHNIFRGDAVYAAQNGCRFSSFGLAEIYFDVDNLYQAASYRLAALLVRGRWLGAADSHGEKRYTDWVKHHLLQPAPPSFLPDVLARRVLTMKTDRDHTDCWLDRLERDLEKLRPVDDERGFEVLEKLLNTHDSHLRPGGPVDQTIGENLKLLRGDANTLGPLRERLQKLAAGHFSEYGVATTLRLLDKYRDALDEIRRKARAQADANPKSNPTLLARLREAGMVPLPVHKLALSIEFPRARDEVAAALRLRYAKAAAVAIDGLLEDINRYIGASNQPAYPDLAKHGTLHGTYTEVQRFLTRLAERLDYRFRVASSDDKTKIDERSQTAAGSDNRPKVIRRYSLSPGWDEDTYDKRIDEALVGHPEIKEADSPSGRFAAKLTFDAKRFVALTLKQLRESPLADLGQVLDVAGVIHHWIAIRQDNPEGIRHVAELLAQACKIALRGAKDPNGNYGGGFQLKEEEKGNAIDFLVGRPEWAEILERIVKASMPYFQTTDPTRISNDFSPAFSNLFGQRPGEAAFSGRNAAKVFEKVKEIVAARSRGNPNPAARAIDRPLAADHSAIILVREMTGFPLQFYAHLEELHRAYEAESTPNVTGETNECHINYHEASQDLPDIALIDTPTYTQIRSHVSYVLRGMILEAINWKEGVLKVSVPDPHQPGGPEIRLGTRLHRVIKYACEHALIRDFLAQHWRNWVTRATPRDWACLYASGRMTWRELTPERGVREGMTYSPLRNCYDSLLGEATSMLKSTEEGRRWFEALREDSFEAAPADGHGHGTGTAGETLAQRLRRECLRRLSPDLPIYQVIGHKVAGIELP